MFAHEIQPHMKCSPVVNGCSTGLCRYIGIFPDTFTLGAAHGLIFALTNKRKALAPLLADQVLDGVQFTGLTTPPGIYCGRTMAVEQTPGIWSAHLSSPH